MLLRINDLDVTAGSRVLIQGFSASWPKGLVVAILGPNGVGKSSLLDHIVGLRLKEFGRVFLNNRDVCKMSHGERARNISSVSQYDHAPLETRAFDRIAHGLYPTRKKSDAAIMEIAAELGIEDFLGRPLYALSGGQRKKVHIARALVNAEAKVFVLDEPDASLDAEQREKMLALISQMSKKGKLVVVSLHHKELAARYADNIIDLNNQTDLQSHQPVQQTRLSY